MDISGNISQYLSEIPLDSEIKLYNHLTVKSAKPMGYCAIMANKIITDLDNFHRSDLYVCCFIDENNKVLKFKDTDMSHHVFIYNEHYLIDPLLCRCFLDLDLYLYFIAQTIDIDHLTSNKINVILHKIDINTDIYKARCQPYRSDSERIRLDIKGFNNVPLNRLNEIEKRIIT